MKNWKETKTSTVIGVILIGAGIYVGAKHYKNPGFWSGFLCALLVSGSLSVKLYTNNKK